MPRVAFWMAQTSACNTCADRAREASVDAERECGVDKVGTRGATELAVWIFIFLIIWTQLFHCK